MTTRLTVTDIKHVESLDGELMGLPARAGGWGLFLSTTPEGKRFTSAGDPWLALEVLEGEAGKGPKVSGAEILRRAPIFAMGWPGDDMFGAYWHDRRSNAEG